MRLRIPIPPWSLLVFLLAAGCEETPDTGAGDTDPDPPSDTDPEPDPDTGPDTGSPTDLDFPDLYGIRGDGGTLLWLDEEQSPSDWAVQRESTHGDWESIFSGEETWLDTAPPEDCRYRLWSEEYEQASDPLLPDVADLDLTSEQEGDLLFSGEELAVSLVLAPSATGAGLDLFLQREQGDSLDWMDPACVEEAVTEACWLSEPGSLAVQDSAETLDQPLTLYTDAEDPTVVTLTATLGRIEADGSLLTVATTTLEYLDLARQLYWGDLHAHTNLSNDGCEEEGSDCALRNDLPGEDFFQNAVDAGLDFAAMTEHAEYETYRPNGEGTEPAYDIFETIHERVADAEAAFESFVPLVGYEWTYATTASDADHFYGGHRHVIFQDTEICDDYYVGYDSSKSSFTKEWDGQYYEANGHRAPDPDSFFAELEAAADLCGEERLQVVPHHSLFDPPQAIDWTWDQNVPDGRFTDLVEICSEHGSSECHPDAGDHCDWRPRADTQRYPEGSVQFALAQGFVLGFAGGTDSHDSRPGSWEDGGSCVSQWLDKDDDGVNEYLVCHEYGGSLTGALVAGELTRETLFDVFEARNTVVSSDGRRPLRVAAVGSDGQVYLPGDLVPTEATPLRLRADATALLEETGGTVLGLEVLDATNVFLVDSTEAELDTDLELTAGEAVYVRLRYELDGDEARIWASPFFGATD